MIVNKDAKKAFQSISGLFILYIFSIANDISRENKRSKVMPQDVYEALKETGFEKYASELGEFMINYDQKQEDKKANKLEVQGSRARMMDDELNDLNREVDRISLEDGNQIDSTSKRLKYEDDEE